jgi:beta-N-acetylhexosaminidase
MNENERDAGRVLLAGFEPSAYDAELERLLTTVRPGGVIFFRRNIADIAEFAELIGQVTAALGDPATAGGRPGLPVLAIDMEGGTVDRLRDALAPLPSARAVAATADDVFVRQFGALIGEVLAGLRLNLDLAPVLDLSSPEGEPVLGSRTVSADPGEVVRFARNFLAGLNRFGILGCGKHFPGLGSGTRDTHLEMAAIPTPAEQLWERDMLPFRELHENLLLVMVGHAWYPALHPDAAEPCSASLSRTVVTELLRGRIGFRGVVVADDLEMGGALGGRTVGEAVVAALEAGCDLLPICHAAGNVYAAHNALVERAAADPAFAIRLAEAARRVEVLQQSLRTLSSDHDRRAKPDWRRLADAIHQMNESAEHLGRLAAERPRYSAAAAAARPRKPERGSGGPRRGGPRGEGGRREGGRGDRGGRSRRPRSDEGGGPERGRRGGGDERRDRGDRRPHPRD